MKNILYFICTLIFIQTGFSQEELQESSLLWKIEGNNLQESSYLYGTMHVADQRVFQFGPEVMPAFGRSQAFAMEVISDSVDVMDMLQAIMMKDGQSLDRLLSRKNYRKVEQLFTDRTGMPMAFFDQVQPMYISIMITEQSFEEDSATFLDDYLHGLAKIGNKRVIGIETIQEQLDAIHVLTYKEQAKLLMQQVNDVDIQDALEEIMMEYYLEGNIEQLLKLSWEYKMPEKLLKSLVFDRNIKMADRIAGYIHEHPTFIAIGALHLPGNSGVIELLRLKGYEVTAVR